MIQTVEAVINEHGDLRLLEPVKISGHHRAELHETALLSEQALGKDWSRPEEDTAWSHLQPAP